MTTHSQSSALPWIIISATIIFTVGSCSLLSWYGMKRSFEAVQGVDGTSRKEHTKLSEDKIAQLEVDGVILGSREDIFDSLDEIEEDVKDGKIKGMVIHIDSPGGSVAPTQELYSRVKALRKTIPVDCSMSDVAASGGYYLASICEEIFALPGTTTGSIGVIFQLFNFEELANWAKVKPITIKAGKLKDVGSPFRAMKPEEQQYLQALLDSVHEQFIRDVLAGRNKRISEEQLREIADGRIVTGEQAKKYGLVDEMGGLNDAIDWLKDKKKLGDLDVVRFPKPRKSFDMFFNSKAPENLQQGLMYWGLEHVRPYNGLMPMLLSPTIGITP